MIDAVDEDRIDSITDVGLEEKLDAVPLRHLDGTGGIDGAVRSCRCRNCMAYDTGRGQYDSIGRCGSIVCDDQNGIFRPDCQG